MKGLLTIIILAQLIIISYLFFTLYKQKVLKKESGVANSDLHTMYRMDLEKTFLFEGMEINRKISLGTLDNDSINFAKIIKGKKLFLRISEFHCQSCVEFELKNLSTLADSIGRDNIIILSTFSSFNRARSFFQLHNLKLKCYLIAANGFDRALEELHKPYYFIGDGNCHTVNLLFFPNMQTRELTNRYLLSAKKRFF